MIQLNHNANHKYSMLLTKGIFILFILTFAIDICKSQTPISPETAFLWNLKLDTLSDNIFTEEYLYRFQRESFRLFKNDEFEMKKAQENLSGDVNKLDDNTVYTVRYNSEFGSYDFDTKGFSCAPFTPETRIPINDFVFGTRLPTNAAIELAFLNSSEIVLFPIDEEKANMLIKERKNYKNGKIDRSILLNIHFVFTGMYVTENVSNKNVHTLTARILQVDFHDSNELDNEPLCSTLTTYKQVFDSENQLKEEHTEMTKKLENLQLTAEPDDDLIIEIRSILSNGTLNNELKASLIKATLEHYGSSNTNTSSTNN